MIMMIGPHRPRLPGCKGVETAEDGGGGDGDRYVMIVIKMIMMAIVVW